MKWIRLATCLLIGLSAASTPSRAQFFKKLVDNVKQTVQNKTNDKASQATGNAMDKALSPTSKTSGSSPGQTSGTQPVGDTATTNRLLGSFAKAAQDNPNDTSAASLTMKGLGLFIGGGGVSAADSAAAIRSFMTSKGGSGIFYQTRITMEKKGKNASVTKDTTLAYMTNGGEGRSEMRIPIPGVKTNKMVIIGRADKPAYSISLDDDAKTYSLNVIDTSLIYHTGNDQATRIGEETIAGYHCIHARVTSSTGSGMFKSTSTYDVWTSTDVPGYEIYRRVLTQRNASPGMLGALERAGCAGFLVKMTSGGKDYSMTMELIRAQEKSLPASLFAIPSNYKEEEKNMLFQMMPASK